MTSLPPSLSPSAPAKSFDWLSPLPLPDKFSRTAFKFRASHQLGIALMLNILSLAVPIMMLQVYDRIIPHQSYDTLKVLIFGVLVALALDAMLRIMRAWLAGWAAASTEHSAGGAALDHIARADLPTFMRMPAGEHMQNFSALVRLREFYSGQSLTTLVDLPFALLFIGLVAYIGGWLVLVPLTLLVTFVLSAVLSGRRLKNALDHRRHADDRKSNMIISILTGIHSVKALGMESPLLRLYENTQAYVTRDSYRVALASGTASILSAGFGQLSLILTATLGSLFVLHGSMTVGSMSACILLAGRVIQPIQRALGTWLRLQDLTISRAQAQRLFDMPARAAAQAAPAITGAGRVIVKDVSFSYQGQDTPLINRVSMSVRPGQTIAIKGEKSSGKSTFLQLLTGTLAPVSGEITLNDITPSRYGMAELISHVSYLPQEGTIFRGTILENITGFRNDEATIAKAMDAALDLGLDQVVDQLPYGYQTLLSDSASDPIPPGVKQRIALTRVLMHRPSVLLFDDADRALDKGGYNLLFRLIGRLKGACTIIMVSHDQNLLSFADHSYHLDNGTLTADQPASASNISLLAPFRTDRPYNA